MQPIKQLRKLGQRLWLDGYSPKLYASGRLPRYINDYSISGLTTNPHIFAEALASPDHEHVIGRLASSDLAGDALLLELMVQELQPAARALQPAYRRSGGADGWVSMELAPGLAFDSDAMIAQGMAAWSRISEPNMMLKVPGTRAGLIAGEELLFRGIPVNFTLLFSPAQYRAAANAYMNAIERRIDAGFDVKIGSVASVFVSRWDRAVSGRVPGELRDRLGIAIAKRVYTQYCELLASERYRRLRAQHAHRQQLVWTSTGAKSNQLSETLYVDGLVAPGTTNTVPEHTLIAFAERGAIGTILHEDSGDAAVLLDHFAVAGIKVDLLADCLQVDGVHAFHGSWNQCLELLNERKAGRARRSLAAPDIHTALRQ